MTLRFPLLLLTTAIATLSLAQIGVGGFRFSGGSTAVQSIASSAPVAKVGIWGATSVAVRADGSVVAWGDWPSNLLQPPLGLRTVRDVALGSGFVIALLEDGTLTGWGTNIYGTLNFPAGLTNVKSIASGASHCAAVTNDGHLVVWGTNYQGVLNPPQTTNISAVSIGYSHSLALTTDGHVLTWGGLNGFQELNVPAGLSDVVQVCASNTGSHAVKSDGTVVSWGQSYVPADLSGVEKLAVTHGQSSGGGGAFPNTSRYLAITSTGAVIGNPGVSYAANLRATELAVGDARTHVLLESGRLLSVENTAGFPFTAVTLSTPYGLNDAIGFACSDHGLTLVRANGTVSQVGTSGTRQTTPHGLRNVVEVAATDSGAYARRSDGSLVSWGNNRKGELVPSAGFLASAIALRRLGVMLSNTGTATMFGDPGSLGPPPITATGLKSIVAGDDFAVGLKPDGTIVSWGSDFRHAKPPSSTSGIAYLAANEQATIAATTAGQVLNWGDYSLAAPAGLTGVAKVAAGQDTFAALKSDGTIVTWSGYSPANSPLAGMADLGIMGKLTVGLAKVWIEIRDASCYANDKVTGTVYLGAPAPAGGAVVTLASEQPSLMTLPTSVKVSAGAQSKTFTISVKSPIAVTTKAVVGCSYSGVQNYALFTLKPTTKRVVQEISFDLPEVTGGSTDELYATVRLNKAAPGDGVTVKLTCTSPNIQVPPSVLIPGGQKTLTFLVSHLPVNSPEPVLVKAIYNGANTSTLIDLVPVRASMVNLTPWSFYSGESSIWRIWLNSVMTTDTPVSLSVGNPHVEPPIQNVQYPTTAVVPAGANFVDVALTTNGAEGDYTYLTNVLANLNDSTAWSDLFIKKYFNTVSLSPENPYGLQGTSLSVRLYYPAPAGGQIINLSSDSPNLVVPASVTIAGGQTQASVKLIPADVTALETATVTVSHGASVVHRATKLSPNVISAFTATPLTFVGGSTTTVTGTITLKAPVSQEVTITLQSNNACVSVPPTVKVAAGQNKVTIPITHTAVTATKTVTITATRLGVSKTVKLTVNP